MKNWLRRIVGISFSSSVRHTIGFWLKLWLINMLILAIWLIFSLFQQCHIPNSLSNCQPSPHRPSGSSSLIILSKLTLKTKHQRVKSGLTMTYMRPSMKSHNSIAIAKSSSSWKKTTWKRETKERQILEAMEAFLELSSRDLQLTLPMPNG